MSGYQLEVNANLAPIPMEKKLWSMDKMMGFVINLGGQLGCRKLYLLASQLKLMQPGTNIENSYRLRI